MELVPFFNGLAYKQVAGGALAGGAPSKRGASLKYFFIILQLKPTLFWLLKHFIEPMI